MRNPQKSKMVVLSQDLTPILSQDLTPIYYSYSILFPNGSFAGLQFGFLGRGFGLATFGLVTNTGVILDEAPGQP